MRALAAVPGQALTYSCVPPGSGRRIGIDRDADLMLDGDERDAGSDPGDPTSLPADVVRCDSGTSLTKPLLKVSKNASVAGAQRLNAKGEFVLAHNDAPIDPIAYGFSFRVDDKDGNTVFARTVPPGAPVERRDPGWKANRKNTKWSFKDRDGTLAAGITRVTVQDKSNRTPGLFAFKVTGKNGDFQIDPAALPLSLVVVLGNGYQTSIDQCAAQPFDDADGVKPLCSVAGKNDDRITCR